MRVLLPAAALAVVIGTVWLPVQAQQRPALPTNVIGSGPAVAARTSALSSWTSVAKMPIRQVSPGVVQLGGKIYVYGGGVSGDWSKQMQVYDIATNTWSMGAELPFRLAFPGGFAKDGLLYNNGGDVQDPYRVQPSTSLVYNPATNSWATSTLAEHPNSRFGNLRGPFQREWIAADGTLYVNEPELGTAQTLNTVTNIWSQDFLSAPRLSTSQNYDAATAALVLDANGLLHSFGGGEQSNYNYWNKANTRHAVYNPATRTWTSAAPLPVPKLMGSAILGADGNLYLIGGGPTSVDVNGSVYIYNPTTDSWSTGPSLPIVPWGFPQLVTHGNDIYVVDSDYTYRATILQAGVTWTGGVSSSWMEAGNWSSGTVPTATDDVTIPAGLSRYPSLSTGAPTARTLTVASGAQLTLADGGTLSLTGNLVNNGTVSATGSGTLAFTGSTAQTLGGTTPTPLQNLTVGPAGASLAGPVSVQRQLTLTGNLSTSGQRLVLASTSGGTALVVNSGGQVTGPVMVQRYIDPVGNPGLGYRHYSAPLSGLPLSALTVSGSGAGPLLLNEAYNSAADPSTVNPFPTVFAYDERRVTDTGAGPASFDQGWLSPTGSLVAGQGLTINQTGGATVEVTGAGLGNGPITVGGLTRGSGAEAGWQLLGNPYPSPIDWNRVGRSNMEAAAYVYRSTGQYDGGYTAYVNGVGTNILPLGQAFFVRVSAPGAVGSVSFTNAARETSYQDPSYARPAQTETRPLVQLQLQRQGQSGPASQDEFYVYEQAGASVGFDGEYDAVKVQLNGGQQPSLYQVVGNEGLAIQGLPVNAGPRSLALGVHAPVAGSYVFSAAQLLNLPAGEPVYLEDKLSGVWQDLRQGAYTVSLQEGRSTTRFVLHLHEANPLSNGKATAWAGEVQLYPNPANNAGSVTVVASAISSGQAELVLVNSLGQRMWQQTAAVAGQELRTQVPVAGLAAGIYTLQLRTAAGLLTRKLILQ